MRYLITGARPPNTDIEIQYEFDEFELDDAKQEIADYLKTNRIAFLRVWTLDNALTHNAWEEKDKQAK